jgi:hypothetical protein
VQIDLEQLGPNEDFDTFAADPGRFAVGRRLDRARECALV